MGRWLKSSHVPNSKSLTGTKTARHRDKPELLSASLERGNVGNDLIIFREPGK
jgi:hypothetical protein